MSEVKIDTAELDRLIQQTPFTAAQILNRMGFECLGFAQAAAPVDTGALKNSGMVEPSNKERLVVTVAFTVEYAAAVELGHLTRPFKKSQGCQRFVPARPYLRPAFEKVIVKLNSGETWRELCQ